MLDRFIPLPKPSTKGSYSVEENSGQRCRVGRSFEGHPAVLLTFTREKSTPEHRVLNALEYRPPAEVEVVGGEKTRVAILECKTTDAQLIAYFFRITTTLILDDARTQDEDQFTKSLDKIIHMVRSLQRPGARSVQGLWAELAMIVWSAQPDVAIQAWHSNTHDLHDFSAGSFRLEVKSSAKALREHQFLLDQLSSMDPGTTLIASMLLCESTEGASVGALVEEIRLRTATANDVFERVLAIVAESLGAAWKESDALKFDLEAARASLQLYETDHIPTVPQPLPAGVRDVRFVADLSNSPTIELTKAREIADLYAVVLPEAP